MTAATQLIRTRARRAITELDRARTAVDRVADDGPSIVRRAEEARLDPRREPAGVGAGWAPADPVGGSVSTGLSDQLVSSAADLDASLVDVEGLVAALATATSTLEARRLACLEASPITDQERADLIAEETR